MTQFVKFLQPKVFISLLAMLTTTIVFGQTNYGNFSTGSFSNNNVGIGTSPEYYYKLSVTGFNAIKAQTTASGSAIYAIANNSNAKAISGYSTSGYAGYFVGQSYFSTRVGIGVNPTSLQGHEQLAVRNGSITVDGEGNGFLVNPGGSVNDWGTRWYGLFEGDQTKLDLATGSNAYHDPVLVNGFYGIGFRTVDGKMTMNANGAVTIGLDDSEIELIADELSYNLQYSLFVRKGIRTEKVKVDNHGSWPDYVFADTYQLPTLQEVATFIAQNHHLPNVPSAEMVEKEGIDLGEMNATLLQKIEELMLYTIQQQEAIEALKEEVEALKK